MASEPVNLENSKYKSKIITIPNLLSFVRLCLIPLIVWLYTVERNYVWTGIVLILSFATDVIDGFIARTFNMQSDLGKILDPAADKLTQATMLICLVLRFPLMLLPLCILLAKDIYMAISGALVIQRTGEVMGADWHGKVATGLLYAMMILHVFWGELPKWLSVITISICAFMIAVSFFFYYKRNSMTLEEAEVE